MYCIATCNLQASLFLQFVHKLVLSNWRHQEKRNNFAWIQSDTSENIENSEPRPTSEPNC